MAVLGACLGLLPNLLSVPLPQSSHARVILQPILGDFCWILLSLRPESMDFLTSAHTVVCLFDDLMVTSTRAIARLPVLPSKISSVILSANIQLDPRTWYMNRGGREAYLHYTNDLDEGSLGESTNRPTSTP